MSGSIAGIKTFMKAIIGQQPWLLDPLCIRKKWDDDAYSLSEHGGGSQLCFGFMWNDGVVVPHPPVERAMRLTKAALEAAGHKGTYIYIYLMWHTRTCPLMADASSHRLATAQASGACRHSR